MASELITVGGSMATSPNKLKQMVLQHVPHGSAMVVVTAPGTHAQALGSSDLHMVNKIPVPERLENPVGKACYQYILHRLLPQVMVNSVDLVLFEVREKRPVQLRGRLIIGPEGFLNDDAPPVHSPPR